MSERTDFVSRMPIAAYAGVVYLSSLTFVFFASIVRHTHAAGAAGVPLVAAAIFAALVPFIWRGSRWAMLGTFAVSVVAAITVVNQAPRDLWLALPFPVVFGLLTATVMVVGSPPPDAGRSGSMVAKGYAALAYLYSFPVVFLWPESIKAIGTGVDPWGFTEPRHAPYVVIFGFVLGALSIPIWRGQLWAMLLAFALVLAQWLALALLVASFWADPWYAAAPVVSAILTVLAARASSAR
jgi:hypothetical protein